ncbi:MAG: hypothetical protein WCG95_03030 [bacterium]
MDRLNRLALMAMSEATIKLVIQQIQDFIQAEVVLQNICMRINFQYDVKLNL